MLFMNLTHITFSCYIPGPDYEFVTFVVNKVALGEALFRVLLLSPVTCAPYSY